MNDEKDIFQFEGISIPDITSEIGNLSTTISDEDGTRFYSPKISKPIITEDGGTIGKNPNAVHVKRYVFYLKKG